METEYMLKFLGLRLLFAAGLIGVVALIIINPFASERDLVEENIRVGLAADAGSWRVFDPDLAGGACGILGSVWAAVERHKRGSTKPEAGCPR